MRFMWPLPVLVKLITGIGVVLKLVSMPQPVEIYSKIGLLGKYDDRTSVPTGYFGGAMVVEMFHDTLFLVSGVILTLLWVAAYLGDSSIFKFDQKSVSESMTSEVA